jgi:hypothetical protein
MSPKMYIPFPILVDMDFDNLYLFSYEVRNSQHTKRNEL